MVMVRFVAPSSGDGRASTSQTSHRAVRSYDSSSFSQHGAHCYITNFRPRPRPRSYCPWYTYTKRCHERDQAYTPCERVGGVRVREIMRPPTNQSIRRHLSDCSLTSVCPAPPSLLVALSYTPYRHRSSSSRLFSPTGSGPMPDTHARMIAYPRARMESTDWRQTWKRPFRWTTRL